MFSPKNLISGVIPHKADIKVNPAQIVWNTASIALDNDNILIVHSVFEDKIWYMAAPASDFSSEVDFYNPLALALPGNTEYKGDGYYLFTTNTNLKSFLLIKNGALSTFTLDSSMDYAFEQGMPTHEIVSEQKDATNKWSSLNNTYINLVADISKKTSLVLIAIILLSSLIVIFSSVFYSREGFLEILNDRVEIQNKEINQLKHKIEAMDSKKNPLVSLAILSDHTIKMNGVILNANYKGGLFTWEIKVPEYSARSNLPFPHTSEYIEKDNTVVFRALGK